jgi:hypothetical protein
LQKYAPGSEYESRVGEDAETQYLGGEKAMRREGGRVREGRWRLGGGLKRKANGAFFSGGLGKSLRHFEVVILADIEYL